jgi:hypothetical protein
MCDLCCISDLCVFAQNHYISPPLPILFTQKKVYGAQVAYFGKGLQEMFMFDLTAPKSQPQLQATCANLLR